MCKKRIVYRETAVPARGSIRSKEILWSDCHKKVQKVQGKRRREQIQTGIARSVPQLYFLHLRQASASGKGKFINAKEDRAASGERAAVLLEELAGKAIRDTHSSSVSYFASICQRVASDVDTFVNRAPLIRFGVTQ